MKTKVMVLKLSSGEEIIGTVDDDYYVRDAECYIKEVFTVTTRVTEDGRALCYLEPFLLYANTSGFTIAKNNIITGQVASNIAVEYYLKVLEALKEAQEASPPHFVNVDSYNTSLN